jgi:hypothetical protein
MLTRLRRAALTMRPTLLLWMPAFVFVCCGGKVLEEMGDAGAGVGSGATANLDSGGWTAANGDATTMMKTGGRGMDAGKGAGKDAAKDAEAACMDAAVNVAVFDSGDPWWSCFQKAAGCGGTLGDGAPGYLTACGANCVCNSAFYTALLCARDGGAQPVCYTPAVTSGALGASWYLNCYMPNMMACNPDGRDASMSEGGGGEGG